MAGTNPPIPAVPIRTRMFDEKGSLTRPWVLFFERVLRGAWPGKAGGPMQRTLLLKNTAVGDDVADHVTVYAKGSAARLTGVLRKPITAALTVRVKLDGTELATLTIPQATAVDTPVTSQTFALTDLPDLGVLSWDVVASDGQVDAAGVASFTLEWA